MSQEAAAPTTPAPQPRKKKGFIRRLFKWSLVLLVLLGVAIVAAPAVASATFLTSTVRSQLKKQFGDKAEVGKVSFGWTTGLVVEKVRIPSSPDAREKDRNAVELEGVHVAMSVPALVKAAATGGEAETVMVVDSAKVYLELHPDGKTNIATPEAKAAPAPVDSKAAATETASSATDDKPLPCSAKTTIDVKSIDLEVADMTSSTGFVQRTVMKGLHMGLAAKVDEDRNAQVDTLTPTDSTVKLDELRITAEEPNKPSKLVVAVDKPSVIARLKFAGKLPKSAAQAATKAIASLHQLDAIPTLDVSRIYSDDFDLRGLAIKTTIGPDGDKHTAKLTIDGKLHGDTDGGISIAALADLSGGKGKLPVTYELHLNQVEISGLLAKKLPLVLPVLAGAESGEKGKNKLPALSFNAKGSVEASFDAAEKFARQPTVKSIADTGEMLLGPGSFDGSKILKAFVDGFEKLDLKEYVEKAAGGDPFSFDGVIEAFRVKDGVITIDKLELAKQGFGLALSGTVDFDGNYQLAIHFDDKMYAKLDKDTGKLLQAVDKAGGLAVSGNLAGGCSVATPSASVLAKAMLDGGALDLLRAKNPKAAAALDGALGKAGTSVQKIVDDPAKAAKDTAKDQAEKQTDKVLDKNKDKIEKTTGVSEDKVKSGLKGIFGGSGDKKDESKPADKPADDKKEDEKKPLFKNPFGG